MPKPIVLVGVVGKTKDVTDTLEALSNLREEYHVIVHLAEEFDFRVFYEKDFSEVKYEELKQIVEESLKK